MNTSHVEGAVDNAKGSLKQAVGETFHDESLANEGAADQVKGHAKEAWGSIKDTASDITDTEKTHNEVKAEQSSHDFRQSVTTAAAHAKESVERGLDHLKEKVNH